MKFKESIVQEEQQVSLLESHRRKLEELGADYLRLKEQRSQLLQQNKKQALEIQSLKTRVGELVDCKERAQASADNMRKQQSQRKLAFQQNQQIHSRQILRLQLVCKQIQTQSARKVQQLTFQLRGKVSAQAQLNQRVREMEQSHRVQSQQMQLKIKGIKAEVLRMAEEQTRLKRQLTEVRALAAALQHQRQDKKKALIQLDQKQQQLKRLKEQINCQHLKALEQQMAQRQTYQRKIIKLQEKLRLENDNVAKKEKLLNETGVSLLSYKSECSEKDRALSRHEQYVKAQRKQIKMLREVLSEKQRINDQLRGSLVASKSGQRQALSELNSWKGEQLCQRERELKQNEKRLQLQSRRRSELEIIEQCLSDCS